VPQAKPADGTARLVVGLQPVREAIRRHAGALREVLIEDRPTPKLEALGRFAADQGVTRVRRVPRSELDRHARGVAHQGAAAFAPELALVDVEALAADPDLSVLALDGVQDPQNFGAVVRSVVGLGGTSLLWGEHASAPLTPATFRASAGAIEHARLCRVPSLTGALGVLRDSGALVVGLDPTARERLSEMDLSGRTVLVLGGEGEGLGRAVRRACSALASLGETNGVDSLNVSVAAGIALYELRNQRIKSST
jgi:23S rRNA (guanosine2251-2'-O)-methyltransferase